jgi:hypothetical protein
LSLISFTRSIGDAGNGGLRQGTKCVKFPISFTLKMKCQNLLLVNYADETAACDGVPLGSGSLFENGHQGLRGSNTIDQVGLKRACSTQKGKQQRRKAGADSGLDEGRHRSHWGCDGDQRNNHRRGGDDRREGRRSGGHVSLVGGKSSRRVGDESIESRYFGTLLKKLGSRKRGRCVRGGVGPGGCAAGGAETSCAAPAVRE